MRDRATPPPPPPDWNIPNLSFEIKICFFCLNTTLDSHSHPFVFKKILVNLTVIKFGAVSSLKPQLYLVGIEI